MKQALIKSGNATVQEVPAPTLTGKDDVLIKTSFSLISRGTEMTAMKYSSESLVDKAKRRPDAVASVLKEVRAKGVKSAFNKVIDQLDYLLGQETGYSASGIVIAVGENVRGIKPGDRVACAGANFANHAEVNCVPKNLVVKIPKNVSLKNAASTTVGAIALQSVRQAHPHIGDYVAVTGLGLVGLIIVQILKANGVTVIGIDPDKKRQKLAKDLGVDHVFSPEEAVDKTNRIANGQGVDSTIIAAATESNKPLQQAMELTRKRGTVVLLGIVGKELKQNPFFQKEISLLVSTSYGPGRYDPEYEDKNIDYPYAYVRWTENRNMQAYLKLLSEDKIKLDKLITKTYSLKKATDAFEYLNSDDNPIMIFLEYEQAKTKIEYTKILKKQVMKTGINLAVIGAGWIAKDTHLPLIKKNKHLNLYSVADIKGVNAQKTAKYFHANKSSTDFKDVFSDKKVDTVLITTRHDTHAQLVIEALKHGKSVFVEKPLVLKKSELKPVITAYKKYKKPVIVGFNRRFSQYSKQLYNNVMERKNPLIINYRVNAGFVSLDQWLQDIRIGGGRIIGEMCHFFDFFNFITNSYPKKIKASSLNPVTKDLTNTDNVVATIEYEDGSLCTLLYTALGNNKLSKENVEVYCDGNIFVLDDYKELKAFGNGESLKIGPDKGFEIEWKEWTDFLTGLGDIPITFEECVLATEMSFEVMEKLRRD